MNADIFTYTDTVETFVTKQVPGVTDDVFTGFVKDPQTEESLAIYLDGRNVSSTKFKWKEMEPNGGLNEACVGVQGIDAIAF